MHKYNMGMIGNCSYLALVDDRANISWLCWPQFDSSFIFGGLLDKEKGGFFYIRPSEENFRSYQKYTYNTNVLETYFETSTGKFKVVDFAPRIFQNNRYYKPLMLVRKIVPIEGVVSIRAGCRPMADYGERALTSMLGSNHIRYEGLPGELRLTSGIPIHYIQDESEFVVRDDKYLVLTYGPPMEAALESTAERFLQETVAYWQQWIKRSSIVWYQQTAVIRSLLTLKMHQFEETGAIIAAATTSLPESPGSGRNWDYRFCWMRDAHYTLKALNDSGHFTELEGYAHYIENTVLNRQNYQPLHPIIPNTSMEERILDLAGYDGHGMVRIGNQAAEHTQNDIYGQLLVTLLPLFTDRRLTVRERLDYKEWIHQTLARIEQTMNDPDNGIWEFRNKQQRHCYTFLFHWAGSYAARRIGESLQDQELFYKAGELIKLASGQVEACYDAERGVYKQAIENGHPDASLLQLINMSYLDPSSEKARKHLSVLESSLHAGGGLFYRYIHEDDFGKPDSTFLICGFWYVEALARVGRLDEAREYFTNLTKYGNELGLFSEDVEAATGSQWGNFPQTYSHVGLINAAFAIARKMDLPGFLLS